MPVAARKLGRDKKRSAGRFPTPIGGPLSFYRKIVIRKLDQHTMRKLGVYECPRLPWHLRVLRYPFFDDADAFFRQLAHDFVYVLRREADMVHVLTELFHAAIQRRTGRLGFHELDFAAG